MNSYIKEFVGRWDLIGKFWKQTRQTCIIFSLLKLIKIDNIAVAPLSRYLDRAWDPEYYIIYFYDYLYRSQS